MADSQTNSWLAPALTAMGSFATAIAGFIAMRFLDARKDERTYEREKAARDDLRRDKLREHHAEFQRQTLIDLQESFLKLLHSVGALHENNLKIFGDARWKHDSVYRPNELSLMYSDAQAKSVLLISRLSDESARELAGQTKIDCALAFNATNEDDSINALGMAFQSFAKVNARIGKLLRELSQPSGPS